MAESHELEILSKSQAQELFALNRDQWHAMLQQLTDSGQATATGNPETGLSMATETSSGCILIVRPDYGDDIAKPDFIQVTVGYREQVASQLTDTMLEEAISAAKAQMAPEFDTIGNVERLPGGVSIFFTITECE